MGPTGLPSREGATRRMEGAVALWPRCGASDQTRKGARNSSRSRHALNTRMLTVGLGPRDSLPWRRDLTAVSTAPHESTRAAISHTRMIESHSVAVAAPAAAPSAPSSPSSKHAHTRCPHPPNLEPAKRPCPPPDMMTCVPFASPRPPSPPTLTPARASQRLAVRCACPC